MSERRGVVITGSSGMAAATARLLAADGATIGVIGREPDEVATLADEVGGVGAVADLTDEVATEEAFAVVVSALGRLDGVFAAAGASGRRLGDGPAHAMDLDGWEATFRVNAVPMFLAVREGLRAMRSQDPVDGERGSIVVMGSVLAAHPVPSLFATHAYAAAKGAAEAFVRTTAAYYAGVGIRVNCVTPSLVDTPMAARAADDEETMAFAAEKQPLAGGMLDADDVAHAVAWLLGARRVTGQVVAVDGGWGVTGVGR